MPDVDDTIVAVASGMGPGWRGIVRVAGPRTIPCVAACFRSSQPDDWQALKRARQIPGQLQLPPPLGPLPCDLFLWPTRRSYTRQPTAELHTIGSQPLLAAAVRTLCGAGARLAEPGEFTLRAFLAGRIDLAQAEAVLGVIDARDSTQLEVALSQLAGGISGPLRQARDLLLDLCADLEAGLDFADEDLPFLTSEQLCGQIERAEQAVARIEQRLRGRADTEALPRVVLRGSPNVGKSSLWNALIGADQALVSDLHGTTRDYLTWRLELGDLTCLLVDTAGLDQAPRPGLAWSAQQQAAGQARQADLQVLCLDASRRISDWERDELQRTSHLPRLLVLTKADRPRVLSLPAEAIATSVRTGQGLEALRQAIAAQLRKADDPVGGSVASTALRCRESLRQCLHALKAARRLAMAEAGEELVAIELRCALDQLGQVLGTVYTEDVLDRIFSRFCIGK